MAWRLKWQSKKSVFLIILSFGIIVCTNLANTKDVETTKTNKLVFEKKKIKVSGVELTVEIADTPEKITQGLMFRQKLLKKSEGMLFVFKDLKKRTFWMKNTFIPLSIGFFNDKKRLIHTIEMTPVKSEMEKPNIYSSKKPAQYALEVSPNWFSRNKIKLNDRLFFMQKNKK